MRIRIADEVARALSAGRPVVALESSVVAQGLPAPHGVAAAERCEAAVRAEGCVPATVAVVAGELVVGLDRAGLARLAEPGRRVAKAGIRDLPHLLATGADAGTTVSATIQAAALAGIRLFATGGIGGVHRGAAHDVSSDLGALAAHPVAVVSAGAKAILDLPATLEALETLGVPVVGLGVAELPAFYSNRSGLPLEQSVPDEQAAARVLQARWGVLRQPGGVLLANPVPAAAELDPARVEEALCAALAAAAAAKIGGKALTPFLLRALAGDPGLAAVQTNLAVLESNARAAARVAAALATLDRA